MASWTNLSNLESNYIISASDWNVIFGPNGNMQYLKDRADFLLNDYQFTFNGSSLNLPMTWPQGDSSNISSSGTIYYPTWQSNQIYKNPYITFEKTGKYFCILQINAQIKYFDLIELLHYNIKCIITDTSGNLNFTSVIETGYQNQANSLQIIKYQIPFVLDVPFATDLNIGFVAQANYSSAYYQDKYGEPSELNYKILVDCSLNTFKISTYLEKVDVSTSFVLDSTTLNGTSAF